MKTEITLKIKSSHVDHLSQSVIQGVQLNEPISWVRLLKEYGISVEKDVVYESTSDTEINASFSITRQTLGDLDEASGFYDIYVDVFALDVTICNNELVSSWLDYSESRTKAHHFVIKALFSKKDYREIPELYEQYQRFEQL